MDGADAVGSVHAAEEGGRTMAVLGACIQAAMFIYQANSRRESIPQQQQSVQSELQAILNFASQVQVTPVEPSQPGGGGNGNGGSGGGGNGGNGGGNGDGSGGNGGSSGGSGGNGGGGASSDINTIAKQCDADSTGPLCHKIMSSATAGESNFINGVGGIGNALSLIPGGLENAQSQALAGNLGPFILSTLPVSPPQAVIAVASFAQLPAQDAANLGRILQASGLMVGGSGGGAGSRGISGGGGSARGPSSLSQNASHSLLNGSPTQKGIIENTQNVDIWHSKTSSNLFQIVSDRISKCADRVATLNGSHSSLN